MKECGAKFVIDTSYHIHPNVVLDPSARHRHPHASRRRCPGDTRGTRALRVERFYNGHAEGIFKTFSLRGIKDSPPYLHDGRLLTLEDTVEFFNLVLATKLTADEKRDLVAYLRVL